MNKLLSQNYKCMWYAEWSLNANAVVMVSLNANAAVMVEAFHPL